MRCTVNGIGRRWFRSRLRSEAAGDRTERAGGRARLWGYGMNMLYPDRKIWLYQVLEVFGEDCYGVHKLPAAPTIIDGGANIGTFALMAKWARPRAEVVCVEPSANNVSYLTDNVSHFADRGVSIVQAALGRESGQVRLDGTAGDSLRTGTLSGESVSVISLSELLDQPVHLLKLDVEGDELAALEGAGDALDRVERVVVENHEYEGIRSSRQQIMSLLEVRGFDRFRIYGHREFNPDEMGGIVHCCLLESWRSE